MQNATNHSATSAPQPQQMDTGPGAQAITPEEQLKLYTLASLQYTLAQAIEKDASAGAWAALAEAHRADPFLTAADRTVLSAIAEQRSVTAREEADKHRRRYQALREECAVEVAPWIGVDLAANPDDATALIVITVQRDAINLRTTLLMGGQHQAQQRWNRLGAGGWKSNDPNWEASEDRIGIELCEFMEAMDLPHRVADMLPKRRNPASDAAAKAAAEVRNG